MPVFNINTYNEVMRKCINQVLRADDNDTETIKKIFIEDDVIPGYKQQQDKNDLNVYISSRETSRSFRVPERKIAKITDNSGNHRAKITYRQIYNKLFTFAFVSPCDKDQPFGSHKSDLAEQSAMCCLEAFSCPEQFFQLDANEEFIVLYLSKIRDLSKIENVFYDTFVKRLEFDVLVSFVSFTSKVADIIDNYKIDTFKTIK